MSKPTHLQYLSQPLEWYIQEHRNRQAGRERSRSVVPAYTIDELLRRNRNRDYKGIHPFCAAEELGERLSCVMFMTKVQPSGPQEDRDYFHCLYLGPHTQDFAWVHATIMERLRLTEGDVQLSHFATRALLNPDAVRQQPRLPILGQYPEFS